MIVQITLQQATQAQRQHTVEGVDSDLLVGPVVDGTKPQKLGVFSADASIMDALSL
jgi:hypothetical protein